MTNEQIAQLAKDVYEGKVFGSWMIPENQVKNLMRMIFMAAAFLDDEQIQEMKDKDIVELYEYYDQIRTGRSINGFPIFFSHHELTREDALKLRKGIKRLEQLEEATQKIVIQAVELDDEEEVRREGD